MEKLTYSVDLQTRWRVGGYTGLPVNPEYVLGGDGRWSWV